MSDGNYTLTDEELKLVDDLGAVYNAFMKLDELHVADRPEFRSAIHQAQNIILSRAGLRQMIDRKKERDRNEKF